MQSSCNLFLSFQNPIFPHFFHNKHQNVCQFDDALNGEACDFFRVMWQQMYQELTRPSEFHR
eukprot:UN24704